MIYSRIHNRKNKHICRKNLGGNVFIINDIIHFYVSKDSQVLSHILLVLFLLNGIHTYVYISYIQDILLLEMDMPYIVMAHLVSLWSTPFVWHISSARAYNKRKWNRCVNIMYSSLKNICYLAIFIWYFKTLGFHTI